MLLGLTLRAKSVYQEPELPDTVELTAATAYKWSIVKAGEV
jgi:hypothetical protein